RTTERSASTSAAATSDEVIKSEITSTASGRSVSITRAKKQVYSCPVKAFISPPTASMDDEIAIALRREVPLKSRCSRKCEAPATDGVSSREPTLTQIPNAAERTL